MEFKVFMWLVVLAWLWGPSFLFMKVAVTDIPPITLSAVRVGIAAAVLFLVLRLQGRKLPRLGSIWKYFAVMGFFSNALPFALLSWGEQFIDSALAAMLIGTTPLFTIALAHLFTNDDRMSPAKVGGIFLGFGGLIVLLGPALLDGFQATTWGLIAATAAAASYGIGIIYGQQYLRGLPPLVGPTAQLTMAALWLLPISLIIERPLSLSLPAWPALGSLLGLVTFGSVMAYIVYYRVMELTSATNLSMTTYMIPIVATILGVVVLREQLAWNAYLGCMLILFGVMTVNGLFQPIHWRLSLSRLR